MRTWPPCVCPESVSDTRSGTRVKISGSCARRHDGRLICDLGERARQIVDAFEPAPRPLAAAADEGHLVAEPRQPERTAVLAEAHHIVLVHGDADSFQHAPAEHRALTGALGVQVVPPVVIAENGMHAERRLEDAQRIGPLLGSNGARLELVAGGEVAQQHDDVGVELVGPLRDGADALGRHQRTAGMHVGNDADAQVEAGRPSRRRYIVACDTQAISGLTGYAIGGQPHDAGA